MKRRVLVSFVALGAALALAACVASDAPRADGSTVAGGNQTQPAGGHETPAPAAKSKRTVEPDGPVEVATLAGGCFWCVESAFDDLPGVYDAVSGYTGGDEANPTYEQVGSGATGHRESVQVRFDPTKITFAQILDVFWRQIDPTDAGGQFADRGPQYEAAIFAHDDTQRRVAEASKRTLEKSGWFDKPIAVPILPAKRFWPAEEYHQDYHVKNPLQYKSYKWGSGRGPYIESFWRDKAPIRADVLEDGSVKSEPKDKFTKPADEALRARLTPMQYEVTQHEATEPPFRNAFWDNHEPGIYVDVVTGEPLFSSTDKFDSGTGWPSFSKPLDDENVVEKTDRKFLMVRTEVRSKNGDSHLGHLFDDGPAPTGQRYCINSASLRFIPASRLEAEGYGQYAKLFAKGAEGESKPTKP